MNLAETLRLGRTARIIGFDDAPFVHRRGASVRVLGVVCAGTRFEGLVTTRVRRDGANATDALIDALVGGKFLRQLHAVLLDGCAFGGFNVVDLARLSRVLERPCVAVLRRVPDMDAVARALAKLPRAQARLETFRRAGPFYARAPFCFQVQGAHPDDAYTLLSRATDRGHVPEALRLAHLIGGALTHGESGRRA